MIELTAGYAAGIIAFGVVAAQVWCPTALTFVLAGQLGNTESATTWTSVGRYLQSSFWPLILQSDSTKNNSMPKHVVATTFFLPIITILISIAGVITPLGLYEENAPAEKVRVVDFEYVRDSSSWSIGTSLRENSPFTRTCRFSYKIPQISTLSPCPYTNDTLVWEAQNDTFHWDRPNGKINVTVPNAVRDIYSSGTSILRTTVSNSFDIQWRQLTKLFNEEVDNTTSITVGQFQQMESFLLDDSYQVVEGLVVDAKAGGIGFRNHTLPVGYPRGVAWYEDLLFIEPEVECSNTNITVDFSLSTTAGGGASIGVVDLALTDRGGFAKLNTTIPSNDTLNESNVPDLKVRAHSAAWIWTAYTMFLMNVSNPKADDLDPFTFIDSHVGKRFKLPVDRASARSPFLDMQVYSNTGSLFGLVSTLKNETVYENPWNMTSKDFDLIRYLCQVTPERSRARLNTTYVGCNLVRGTPRRVDRPSVLFQDGSQWSSQLYTCASAVKASIKTVKFIHNGTTQNLDNLAIQEIRSKEYRSLDETPLWGFEDWFYRLSEYDPVWGLVNSAYEGFRNITTLRAPSFYMLGSANGDQQGFDPSHSMMNLPAAIGPTKAMQSIVGGDSTSSGLFDFFGRQSMSKWIRVQKLCQNSDSVSNVIKLLWTDMAASALVGTKGVLGAGNAGGDDMVSLKATPIIRVVKFHYYFGIPAYMVAVCIIICSILAAGSLLLGHSSLGTVSQRLKQASVGRALTTAFYPEASNFSMTAKEWTAIHGSKKLDLAGYAAPVTEAPPLPRRPGDGNGLGAKGGLQYSAVPLSPPASF